MKKKIIVVDGESAVVRRLELLLNKAGYTVWGVVHSIDINGACAGHSYKATAGNRADPYDGANSSTPATGDRSCPL